VQHPNLKLVAAPFLSLKLFASPFLSLFASPFLSLRAAGFFGRTDAMSVDLGSFSLKADVA
jgi:hypothetical protein